ncbi:alpha/beta hydrolase [Vibrio sp. S4M6]|uniref:alpha/beta fold hydrolase n=1 Tax=Vibrio sinus TaxID=2946865 RepID=UPI002029E4A8|nr:alpha/beta hydrolase [Vibrio sinus]MCL9782726.1 alpha/beta hydrolase [Vibrio sinus]
MTSSTPLLWLPGFLCDDALFAPVNALLDKSVEPSCAELPALNKIQALAKHVLNNAPQTFILGGLSMGGILAFEVYRQAPDRVKGLILLNTNAADEKMEVTERRNTLVDKALAGAFSAITRDDLMPLLIHPDRAADTQLVDSICQMAENIGVERFCTHAQALATRPDARPLLSDIRVPSLIVCSEDDLLCPVENHLLMRDNIPNARFEYLPSGGHLTTLEQPDKVARMINRWLSSLNLAG